MEMLADTGKVLSAELVEVNPILDRQNGTARLGVGLLASLLGRRSCRGRSRQILDTSRAGRNISSFVTGGAWLSGRALP